jgi:hypothetical protein
MVGTHDLMLYPPGSSSGVYAFRRDYGDGRLVEVVFRNGGSDPLAIPNSAKWSEDNPCHVGVRIRLRWQQPLHYTSSRITATYSTSTHNSGGGTFTCALMEQADFFKWRNTGYNDYDSSDLRLTGSIIGRIPGVATDFVIAEPFPCAKAASVESFGVPITADPFFETGGLDTVALNNHEPRFAMADGEFWSDANGFRMQTMQRSGSWYPLRQASGFGAWRSNSWTTKPSISFVGGTNKTIEMSASRVGDVDFIQTDFNASVSLSLT